MCLCQRILFKWPQSPHPRIVHSTIYSVVIIQRMRTGWLWLYWRCPCAQFARSEIWVSFSERKNFQPVLFLKQFSLVTISKSVYSPKYSKKTSLSDYLAPFSALANVFTAVSVAIIFSYLVPNLQNPVDNPSFAPTQDFEKFALFFGTAIFSFEGISVVLPLENNAETPEDFPKGKGSQFFSRFCLFLGFLFSWASKGKEKVRISKN